MPRRDPTLTSALLAWYDRRRRDLPWRVDPTPYRVWVSEVMLQQTRVETVIRYYGRFLRRFPDLPSLAGAEESVVLSLWSGLGYYRRARALHAGARYIVEEHGGEFPDSEETALAIPGVGPYTAAAVLSIAHGLAVAVVDGNVERVVSRLGRIAGNPKRASVRRQIRGRMDRWIDTGRPGDFNQAMMELGATVCTPTAPRCDACPVRSRCEAHETGETGRFPELPPRRPATSLALEVGLLERRGRLLLERPDQFSFLDSVWVFPLAQPGAGGSPDGASLSHRLSESLAVPVRVDEPLAPLRHAITRWRITLHPFRLRAPGFRLPVGGRFRWARPRAIGEEVPVSSICLKLLRRAGAKREAYDRTSTCGDDPGCGKTPDGKLS